MTRLLHLSFASCVLFSAVGCSEQVAEKAEQAAGSAADTAKDMGDKAADVAGKAADKAGEAWDAIGEEFSAAYNSAKSSLEGVDGGSEMLKNVSGMFGGAIESLKGIKDTETAKAAIAKLDEMEFDAEGMAAKLEALPAGAKTAMSTLFEKGTAEVARLVDKVKGMSDLDESLKARLDEFLEKLRSIFK